MEGAGFGGMGGSAVQEPEEEGLDPEERERLEQSRIDQENRLRSLGAKEAQELDEKRAKREAAKRQLDNWYTQRARDVQSR